jgi:outer membrane lipoprotein-sorting protein
VRVACIALAVAFSSSAQGLDAATEATLVAETYRAMEHFTCSVTFSSTDPTFGEDVSVSGGLWLSDDRFRLELGDDVYVSDGEAVWTYTAADEQVIIEDAGGDDWSQPQQFLTRFDHTFAADSAVSAGRTTRLWLSSLDRAAYVSAVEIDVRASDRLVRRAVLTTTDGQVLDYGFSSFRVDGRVDESRFKFQSPADARVVDMRVNP